MTDVTSYIVSTPGESIESFGTTYTPILCVRMFPVKLNRADNTLLSSNEVYFSIAPEALKRGANKVTVRRDKNASEDITAIASVDRRAGFFVASSINVATLKATGRLLIRFTTSLDQIRLATFSTSGLADAIEDVKRKYKATLPEPPAWNPPD